MDETPSPLDITLLEAGFTVPQAIWFADLTVLPTGNLDSGKAGICTLGDLANRTRDDLRDLGVVTRRMGKVREVLAMHGLHLLGEGPGSASEPRTHKRQPQQVPIRETIPTEESAQVLAAACDYFGVSPLGIRENLFGGIYPRIRRVVAYMLDLKNVGLHQIALVIGCAISSIPTILRRAKDLWRRRDPTLHQDVRVLTERLAAA